jgi:RHS repeat-associated protein
MIAQDGVIGQQTDYYAFGMEMSRGITTVPSPDNKYKYNGKELQDEFSLNQYDYDARFYDPVIGRFNIPDPLAEVFEDLSPFNYAVNNPALMNDPDGMAADTGKVTVHELEEVIILGYKNKPNIEPVVGFWPRLYHWGGRDRDGIRYDVDGKPEGYTPIMGMPPDIGFASTASGLNTVYKGIKGGLPYIGKSFNILKRYTKAERLLMKIEPVIGDIKNAKLLRAIEQKVLEYKKTLGEVANKVNAYSPNKKDYAEYMQKAEKWLSENASNWKDLF